MPYSVISGRNEAARLYLDSDTSQRELELTGGRRPASFKTETHAQLVADALKQRMIEGQPDQERARSAIESLNIRVVEHESDLQWATLEPGAQVPVSVNGKTISDRRVS